MGHIRGTRNAIQDALAYAYQADSSMKEYLTYLCRIDKSTTTGSAQFVRAMQFAKIRAAINSQKQPIPAWLHYCYGPDLASENKARQRRTLSLMLSLRLYTPPISVIRRERIERLCLCAVEDYRMRILHNRSLSNAAYAGHMGTSSDHWRRDWTALQDQALDLLQQWDSHGIGGVSATVREIRDADKLVRDCG